MDDKERAERDAVDRVAREWIGTPFRDEGEVKGPQGGVDCAKLLKCVFVEAKQIDDFVIPHYSPQFFLHNDAEIYKSIVERFAHEIPEDRAQYGDVVLYWIGKCFAHGAIIVKPGWPRVIHAHYASHTVRGGFGHAVHLGVPIKGMKFYSRW